MGKFFTKRITGKFLSILGLSLEKMYSTQSCKTWCAVGDTILVALF